LERFPDRNTVGPIAGENGTAGWTRTTGLRFHRPAL
jgi:hypothetical protein